MWLKVVEHFGLVLSRQRVIHHLHEAVADLSRRRLLLLFNLLLIDEPAICLKNLTVVHSLRLNDDFLLTWRLILAFSFLFTWAFLLLLILHIIVSLYFHLLYQVFNVVISHCKLLLLLLATNWVIYYCLVLSSVVSWLVSLVISRLDFCWFCLPPISLGMITLLAL